MNHRTKNLLVARNRDFIRNRPAAGLPRPRGLSPAIHLDRVHADVAGDGSIRVESFESTDQEFLATRIGQPDRRDPLPVRRRHRVRSVSFLQPDHPASARPSGELGTALVLLRVAPRPSLVRSGRSAVLSSRWWNPHLTHRRRRVARNHLRRNLRCVDPLHLDVFGKRRDFASSYLLGVINVRVGRGPRTRPALRRRPIPERNRTQTSLELNSPMP